MTDHRAPTRRLGSRRPVRVALVALLLLFGGLVFSWAFERALSVVPPSNYAARDDAVVTLSHARNLVDFGFIGHSPSGERIEGFSAPLQFWTAAAAYAATGAGFGRFLALQTAIGTVLLGVLFAGLLSAGLLSQRSARYRFGFALFVLLSSAAILASSRVFLLWHASGMENVYRSVSLVALLWSLDAMLRGGRISWGASVIVLMASLARIDSIVAVAFLLAAFVVLWWLRYRDTRAVRFAVFSLVPWALYMAWRRWYFGAWLPNTAVAQGISMTERVASLWPPSSSVWLDYYHWAARVLPTLHVYQFIGAAVAWPFISGRRLGLERCVLVLAGAAAYMVHHLLFGAVRLDEARLVTELALLATAATPLVLLAAEPFRITHAAAGCLLLACSTVVAIQRPPDRYEIGWGVEWFEHNADLVEALARDHAIPRPTLAIADLGAPSWRKRFNIIDIGLLGSAVTPRVRQVGRYLAEVAKPDIIEIHDAWSCTYSDLFTNPVFVIEYEPVTVVRDTWLDANCAMAPDARSGLWIRRAVMKGVDTPERAFIDAFAERLNLDALREELFRCARVPSDRPCAYVGRTLFRFVPELKARGVYDRMSRMLSHDPRLAIEHAYFVSSMDPGWWQVLRQSWRGW